MRKLGDKVKIYAAVWKFNKQGCYLANVYGTITSIKGMPNHDNIHLYEISNKHGKFYTNK